MKYASIWQISPPKCINEYILRMKIPFFKKVYCELVEKLEQITFYLANPSYT